MKNCTYEFHIDEGPATQIEVDLERDYGSISQGEAHAYWTSLDFHKCSVCPLNSAEHKYCPVALDIEKVTERFSKLISYRKARVRVTSEERVYEKECDVQEGLKSLLGLIMASGECPTLKQLKPMAHFHLPFASVEETIYRTVTSFLLRQYYNHQDGERMDLELDGLAGLYENLQNINRGLLQRISVASEEDANLNAISTLFALSAMVSMTLNEQLEEIRSLFLKELTPAATPA